MPESFSYEHLKVYEMNNNQIKQRLIEASLTDDIPSIPQFRFPKQQTAPHRRWIKYAAAAVVAIAIVLPFHQSTSVMADTTPETTLLITDDLTVELECAFAMVNHHFEADYTNLIDIVQ